MKVNWQTCEEASMSAVWPRLFVKSTVAPPIIRRVETTCACPLKAAKCRAENPSSFLTSTLSLATVSRRSVALQMKRPMLFMRMLKKIWNNNNEMRKWELPLEFISSDREEINTYYSLWEPHDVNNWILSYYEVSNLYNYFLWLIVPLLHTYHFLLRHVKLYHHMNPWKETNLHNLGTIK